jgi:DNA adenine methylase
LRGQFNVPIGTKQKVTLQTDDFCTISKLLSNTELRCDDFENIINQANYGDFIFADPPYTVKHSNNGFIKYNENLFSWNDQLRLAGCLIDAKRRGVNILSTNANHSHIRELYCKHFNIDTISRFSVIAADSTKRKVCEELVIRG